MAGRAESVSNSYQMIELRNLGARELEHLLLEETVEWDQELDWDFSRSADLVRKYAEMRALGGAALMDRGEVAGYGYSVLEDHKGLIGDLYIRPGWRSGDAEVRLFRMMLDDLIASPGVRRIESQLMLVEQPVARALQRERFVRLFERLLMRFDFTTPLPPTQSTQLRRRFRIEPWGEQFHDEVSGVIALSYEGHVDSEINDQYRTFSGAQKFLSNIVQYPGCGEFARKASFVAIDVEPGRVVGIVLTSFVSAEVAHITQLCVVPKYQGAGLGYEMLRNSVAALQAGGAARISLTVTTANTAAVELYRRCGFYVLRHFFAYVWEGQH
jgi:ribosomal protein S18 acetylase RimI-like enzyme